MTAHTGTTRPQIRSGIDVDRVSQLRRTLHNWDYAGARIMWRRARLTAPDLVAGPAAVVLGRHNPAV